MTAASQLGSDGAVLAVDAGGTTVKGAIVDHDGQFLYQLGMPTERHRGPDHVVSTILSVVGQLDAAARSRDIEPVAAGVAVPGKIDEDNGIAISAANMRWQNTKIRDIVRDGCGLPTVLKHDIRAGALAEATLGAARDTADFIFIAIGTGLASTIVLGRKAWAGAHFGAGELGHVVARPGGARCPCGQRGCLETIASASAIAASFALRTGRTVAGAREVADAARGGDPVATDVWGEAIDALADAIVTMSSLLDIDRYVIGGGLSMAGEQLFGALRSTLLLHRTPRVHPEIVPAAFGVDAGCVGVALAAFDLAEGSAAFGAVASGHSDDDDGESTHADTSKTGRE